MWVVSLIIGLAFGALGIAGLISDAETAFTCIVGAGLWLKVAALEKVTQ